MTKDGTETVLYAFCPGQTCTDGLWPSSGLVADKAGNLYGTTSLGGASNAGTVYRLAPDGTESVLYSFTGENDGSYPGGNLIRDKAGNLYGTTGAGGANGGGTIFKLAKSGTLSILYTFIGGSEGNAPQGVTRDSAGNLYVLMQYGGDETDCPGAQYVSPGCGTVVKLATDGTETVLHTFTGGGTDCTGFGPGCGVVFKIAAGGGESVVYAFKGGSDGAYPRAGLIACKTGNLLGTTYSGGNSKGVCTFTGGCGTVFEIAPNGGESVLHAFNKAASNPWAPLLLHKGTLYGTTLFGGGNGCNGTGCGAVFRLKE